MVAAGCVPPPFPVSEGSGTQDGTDVPGLENRFGSAMASDGKHGATDLLSAEDVVGEDASQQVNEWPQERIDQAVRRGLRADAVHGLDETWAKHVSGAKG